MPEVMRQQHRQRTPLGYPLEAARIKLENRGPSSNRVNDHDPVGAGLLRVLAEFDGLQALVPPNQSVPVPGDGNVGDGEGGNGFALIGIAARTPAAAEEEQAVDARGDHVVDQRGGTRFIELAIGGKMVETGGIIPENCTVCGMGSPC